MTSVKQVVIQVDNFSICMSKQYENTHFSLKNRPCCASLGRHTRARFRVSDAPLPLDRRGLHLRDVRKLDSETSSSFSGVGSERETSHFNAFKPPSLRRGALVDLISLIDSNAYPFAGLRIRWTIQW
jgi:hypothetical protein